MTDLLLLCDCIVNQSRESAELSAVSLQEVMLMNIYSLNTANTNLGFWLSNINGSCLTSRSGL